MKRPLQIVILLAAGAGAFVLAASWTPLRSSSDDGGESQVVAAAVRTAQAPTAAGQGDHPLRAFDRAAASAAEKRIPTTEGSAFAPVNWAPPLPPPLARAPAAPAAPPPPPAPVAPPLPFTFIGMVERGAERQQAYLAKGEALLVVAVGGQIENNTYRVDALSSSGVVLTYLPLQKQQTVNAP